MNFFNTFQWFCFVLFVFRSKRAPTPQDPRIPDPRTQSRGLGTLFFLFKEKLSLSIWKEKLYFSLAKAFLLFFEREALLFSPKEKLSAFAWKGSRKQEAGSRKQGAGSMEQEAGGREQGAGSREQGA